MKINKLILLGAVSVLTYSMTTSVFAMKGDGENKNNDKLRFRHKNISEVKIKKYAVNSRDVIKTRDNIYEIHELCGKFGSIDIKKIEVHVK